jgi:predicted RNase H-like nuclease
MFVAGVDGCRDGWIVVALDGGRFAGAGKYATFRDVLDAAGDADAIGVDIPIGLLPEGDRLCDRLAREYVGFRRGSVFQVPPRAAVEAGSYEEASAHARALMGKAISKQVYALFPKILEVDAAVRSLPPARRRSSPPDPHKHPARIIKEKKENRASLLRYARIVGRDHGATAKPALLVPELRELAHAPRAPLPAGRVIEVHPEVSFRELHGAPLEHGKKTYNGTMMRLGLLQHAGIEIPAELGTVGGVALDDVLDAAAAAWSAARYAGGEARSLPPSASWQHDGERVIAIWA